MRPRHVALFAALSLAGCARTLHVRSGDEKPLGAGVASYYSRSLNGRPTASGERYDRDDLTAAHRSLPLGTCVLVVNADNGRSVHVRVNDRGPYAKDRLIDVSEAAARELGMTQQGVARVRLYRC